MGTVLFLKGISLWNIRRAHDETYQITVKLDPIGMRSPSLGLRIGG